MLENTRLVLFTICINYISTEYTTYSNGWIPIGRDQVYNQIHKKWTSNFIHPTLKPEIETNNAIKPFEKEWTEENTVETKKDYEIINEVNPNHIAQVIWNNPVYNNEENIVNATESSRKAKKMIDRSLENNIDIHGKNVQENDHKRTISGQSIDEISDHVDRSTTYEVTEETVLDTFEKGIGYDYSPPTTENQNLSSTFTNILSKYNIKTDDKLKNYDLSRQIKTQNPLTNFNKVSNPFGYNNLNHLPVDPLLAVFLSNYGFYLPSLYGIKSNYNNLYGYLASNNIHNNKPFGLYKVFSDTDSWN